MHTHSLSFPSLLKLFASVHHVHLHFHSFFTVFHMHIYTRHNCPVYFNNPFTNQSQTIYGAPVRGPPYLLLRSIPPQQTLQIYSTMIDLFFEFVRLNECESVRGTKQIVQSREYLMIHTLTLIHSQWSENPSHPQK